MDLVTEVDERAEQVIKEILLGTCPAYGMLAEEGGRLSGEEDARWIVVPLDGSTIYAHELSIFTVSIALERAGEVVLGVVHGPMREETFIAERGAGATLNDEPIRASDTDEPIRALIATGFPTAGGFYRADPSAFTAILVKGKKETVSPHSTSNGIRSPPRSHEGTRLVTSSNISDLRPLRSA